MADYFSADPRYPVEIFRRRFRMSRPLFTHIATTLADRYDCFTLRSDCAGRIGLSTLHKCTSAIRQLAYAGPADMFDEYLQMGETTSLNVLRQFCKGIREVFGPEFLRKPTPDECQRLLDMHGAVRSFSGMMDSTDCMHWEWKNCPVAWKGHFTTGSNNDINVLQSSPIFNDECRGEGPEISFVANGTQYRRGYYLSYGYTLVGPYSSRHFANRLERRDNILRENKRPLGKMLSELLVCSKRDGPFYAARHEFGTKMMSRILWSTAHDQLQVDLMHIGETA
ncbi:uncharacterized protein LOC125194579 [Salvia hispanica]|uniref:uncharacterized protein LOC125194579 n=1 Tax=Salvia hispanica TaxID=49212 RepID=UPI00200922B2|nr:uncharacterized protein LOC125194579 [Salvia hispanica]